MIWQDKEISEPCEIHKALSENGDEIRVIAHLNGTTGTMLVSIAINKGSSGVDFTFHPHVSSVSDAKRIAEELYECMHNQLCAALAYAQTRWP